MQLNFLKSTRWIKGTTSNHRYECMGATALILEHIGGKKNIQILDAGCSDGRATKDCKMWLEKMGHDVSFVAIDQDKQRIESARKNDCGVKFIHSDIECLKEKKFDVIICLNVIRFVLPKPKSEMLRCMAEMLKLDGVLITGISRYDMKKMNLCVTRPPKCMYRKTFVRIHKPFRGMADFCVRPIVGNDTRMINKEKVREYARLIFLEN